MASFADRITKEPGKCGGKACIRGMQIRVADILDMLSAGVTGDEILADYPELEREDLFAVVDYARAQLDLNRARIGGHGIPPAPKNYRSPKGYRSSKG